MSGSSLEVQTCGICRWVSLFCAALSPAALAQTPTSNTQELPEVEEIVVTGSHIRGASAAGSKLIVISREQIDASGYERIEDVLATVTQNFNRSNPAVGDGNQANNFYDRGAEVQLRGLGVGTTLTLVNGQRQGNGGYQGSFTDVSSIPGSAVERIEILPEASSALYGSDAIGGVVNIILRRDFDGLEARARGATADGDPTERTIAGLWGHTVSHGHILVGAQYDGSSALPCSARAYCAVNGDFRRFGGSDLRPAGGNPGTILDPITQAPIAAVPHGQDGTNLTPSQLVAGTLNYTNSVIGNEILPKQGMRSAFWSAAYNLGSRLELSIDGRYSSRQFEFKYPQPTGDFSVPANNAFNHFGVPVFVAYDFTPDVGPIFDNGHTKTSFISTGVKGILPRGWQFRVSTAYSKSRTDFTETNTLNSEAAAAALDSNSPSAALNILGDGSHTNPAALTELKRQSVPYQASNLFTTALGNVIADGTLVTGPAGPIRLAVGGDFRREHSAGLNIADGPENRGRDVTAGFVQFAVPLVRAAAGAGFDRLDLALSGRHDHYSDAGSSWNPKVGLTWRRNPIIGVRGNWGTSFRAPPFFFSNPDQTGDARVADVIDPRSRKGTARALLLIGPYQGLQPETATVWSVGADAVPPVLPDLSLSMTYFDINYRGKIRSPAPEADLLLTQETEFASLITRNPTPVQLDAACKNIRRFYGNLGNCNQRIDAILDNRARNLASVSTRGVDLAADYVRDTTWGKWSFNLNGTYTFDLKQKITDSAPAFDVVNTVGNPLKIRLGMHLAWSFRGWTLLTALNYTGAYQDPTFSPARGVGSWTTLDLNLGYRVNGGKGWLSDTQWNLGVNNLFDRNPPFVNQFDLQSANLGNDSANASLVGRQVGLQIVKRLGS
jgi:iron complex outermembrane recepter protein